MTRSQGFWNFMAPRYAKQDIADTATYERKLAATQAIFTSDMHVLEFGCGTGSTALIHAKHVNHITGIDYSTKMIDIANAKIGKLDNVDFAVATLDAWPSDDAAYDVVMGMNILHLLPDHHGALAKAYRLLKPGGYLVTSTPCLGDMGGVLTHLVRVGSALRVLPYLVHMTNDGLETDMRRAGFTVKQGWRPGATGAPFHICQKPA